MRKRCYDNYFSFLGHLLRLNGRGLHKGMGPQNPTKKSTVISKSHFKNLITPEVNIIICLLYRSRGKYEIEAVFRNARTNVEPRVDVVAQNQVVILNSLSGGTGAIR